MDFLDFCKIIICDALLDFVPFVQFKKREKHPRRSVTFRRVDIYILLIYIFYNMCFVILVVLTVPLSNISIYTQHIAFSVILCSCDQKIVTFDIGFNNTPPWVFSTFF